MTRDQEIQEIFEIADDSLQGVFGLHFYAIALSKSIVNLEEIKTHLPNISKIVGIDAFPLTFSWLRYYRREDLISAFPPRFFERFQARISLTAICGAFDDLLNSFVVKLNSKGYPQHLNGEKLGERSSYRRLINWAFQQSQKCTIGDARAIARLPKTFGIIDEARNLRNLILHHHGIFDSKYESDRIEGTEKVTHPRYKKFKDTTKSIPIIINGMDIMYFSMAHIEVLHILHNQIQKECFNHCEPYDYRRDRKKNTIGWHYVFWGNAKIVDLNAMRKDSYLKVLFNSHPPQKT